MNYFLPPEKMKIVLEYPFARDYFEGKTRRFEFLENLEIFKSELIERGLTENDIEILKHELSEREFDEIIATLSQKTRLATLRLKNNDVNYRFDGLSRLSFMNFADAIPCVPLIEQMLKDEVSLVRERAIKVLQTLQSKSSIPLIDQMLNDPNPYVRDMAIEVLPTLSDELRHHALYMGLDKQFFTPGEKGLGRVKRLEFPKTGSGDSRIISLGGNLAGKVIIRIVDGEAFSQWKKALEAVDAWRKAGFDYIPVEPILMKKGELMVRPFKTREIKDPDNPKWYESVYPGEEKYIVYTQVLGPSLADFLKDTSKAKFVNELLRMKHKVINVLQAMSVIHEHPHDANFCVGMYRDKPRLYIIDFDTINPGI